MDCLDFPLLFLFKVAYQVAPLFGVFSYVGVNSNCTEPISNLPLSISILDPFSAPYFPQSSPQSSFIGTRYSYSSCNIDMFSPGMSVHLDDIYIGCNSGLNPHATPFRPNCAVSTATSSSNVLYSPNNHSSDSTSFMESEASDNPLGTGIPREILKNIKLANPNRLIIGHLNINSLPNKIENLKALIVGNIDILVILVIFCHVWR